MKTQIIALETHDDLISVRDRMSWAKSPRILLAWPKYEKVALRPVDLRVLQQHARFLGADLGLVTRLPAVRRDAERFGIPVFESTGAAQRDAWPARSSMSRRAPRRDRAGLREMRDAARVKQARWTSSAPARVGFFATGVTAVLLVVALFVPRAAIKLTPVSSQQVVTVPIKAGESIHSVNITGEVPAHQISVTVTGSQSARVTSQKSIPEDKASGIARFRNLTQSELTVPAGTVIYSVGPTPIRFVTLNDIHLPAKVNAFIEVPIAAVDAGTTGNVAANVIQAIEGSLGLSAAVTNPEPISGGTERVATVPSDADRKRVRDALMPLLQGQAQKQISDSIDTKDLLLANTLKMGEVLEEIYDPSAGQPGSLLRLTMRIEYSAQYIAADDLRQLAESTLNASVPPGFIPAVDTLTFHPVGTPVLDESGASHFDLQVERLVLHGINQLQVTSLVRGLSPEEAVRFLQGELPLAKEPEVELSPSWWPWLPLIPFRIEVK
jgi:hypothetical protein